jgi:DNA replication protein DnaC
MELTELCSKLKFEYLPAQLDTLCEQAAKRELNYPEFLNQALMTEWQARRLKGVKRGLRLARFPYINPRAVRLQLSARHRPQADTRTGRLRRAHAENRLDWQLAQWITPKVLVVDELGYLPMSREEANLLFRLVARRYERASLIITSNKSFIDWGEVFGDQVLATAILDRLLHHSNVKGESFRLQEKRRAGLLSQLALDNTAAPARDSTKSSEGVVA